MSQPSDRRRFPRVALTLLVQFRVDSYEDFLREYATDLSSGGMFIRTNTPRKEGDEIYFQFAVSGGGSIICGLGKVMHVNPVGGPQPPGMGIEFISLDEKSREVIDEIIQRRLRGPG